VSVFVPVPGSERPRALLAIQAPEDGEPYSCDDFVYLGALAAAGGMALAQGSTSRRMETGALDERTAGECRWCGLVREAGDERCSCGASLEPSLLPLVLNGKFRLTRRLGSGAMGVVYEAEDLDLGRTVALKTLPRVSPDLALRLRQEARSMARVLHPRLAMIFGCESWRGVPVLVLERLAGTLVSRLGSPWSLREALEVGVAAAEGLAAMHVQGLLHRDVKPSNVGFSREGGVKLLDFGIAHLLSGAADRAHSGPSAEAGCPVAAVDLDLTSRVIGTPLYCSPERLGGAAAEPADDVWSLSLLLYELLSGAHPWLRPGVAAGDPRAIPDLRRQRAGCPADVAGFFTRALGAKPAERPRSAAVLRAELVALLGTMAETGPFVQEEGRDDLTNGPSAGRPRTP
jgi:serine/threonine protein kinase